MSEFRATRPAAIILAAGYSSRMGAIKPLLPLEGKPMLLHSAEVFLAAGVGHIIVVTGFHGDKVGALARAYGMNPVSNDHFDEGMFSSVCTGIAAVPPEYDVAFVLPVDIPFVAPQTVRAILEAMETGPIVVPRYAGKTGHPPLLHRSLFGDILGWAGADGLGGFLNSRPTDITCLDVADRFVLRDLDSTTDIDSLLRERKNA